MSRGGEEQPGRWHGDCGECGVPFIIPGEWHPATMDDAQLERALLCAGCAGDVKPETREAWERRAGAAGVTEEQLSEVRMLRAVRDEMLADLQRNLDRMVGGNDGEESE